MYRQFCIAVAILCWGSLAVATDLSSSITGSVSDGTASIPYRLFEPQGVSPGAKLPLILFLHGAGDRGTDNVGQTYWASQLVDHTRGGQYAAYVLAPQINTNQWFSSSGSEPTEAMSLTIDALKQVMATANVDPTRVYVTGVSMGSFGTWDILRRDPGVFAAAVPMSGGGDPSTASLVKDTPIWAFHGSADSIVPVDSTRNMIAAVRAAGGDPKYTEVPGGDHFIWPAIYGDASNTLYPWMFSQRLGGLIPTPAAAADALAAVAAAEPASVVAAAVTPLPEPSVLVLLLLAGILPLQRRRFRSSFSRRACSPRLDA
jgi:predicted peptidase